MIRFIPDHENKNTGTIASMLENVNPILEKKVCAEANQKCQHISCTNQDCKEIDSVVSISIDDVSGITYSIVSSCCSEFRQRLNKFLMLSE
jgi:hypothetical protein